MNTIKSMIYFHLKKKVEYCPSVVASDCWNLMKELLQSLIGNIAESPPPTLKMKMDEVYTPAMTMLQYLDHFNNFRKAAAVSQPQRVAYPHLKKANKNSFSCI
ncbi:mediator complex subunit Med20 [Bulinus truncatus]|nr:mediator complex subunit Med20 [Bulinus truncatus]